MTGKRKAAYISSDFCKLLAKAESIKAAAAGLNKRVLDTIYVAAAISGGDVAKIKGAAYLNGLSISTKRLDGRNDRVYIFIKVESEGKMIPAGYVSKHRCMGDERRYVFTITWDFLGNKAQRSCFGIKEAVQAISKVYGFYAELPNKMSLSQ